MREKDPLIDIDEFKRGCQEFQKREKRDSMYSTASFLVKHYWGGEIYTTNKLGHVP